MRINESTLRRIIRGVILEKGGRHQFHGAGDAETLGQYKEIPGPMFGTGKGSVAAPIPPEEVDKAEKYVDQEEPDELIAYSRGGAMVQELDDEFYKDIKKIKYVAPAAKRKWTSKPVKPAPSGSEAFADSGDSLVSLVQVAKIAVEAGIQNVQIYHDPGLPKLVGQPTGRKDDQGNEKLAHWRGVGIGRHQTAADKGLTNNLDGSIIVTVPASKIIQAADAKELIDWGKGKANPDMVEKQWSWVDKLKPVKESVLRNSIRNILLEKEKKKKREVKCPLLPNGKRDYKCEYQKYGGASKKGKKDRAARNKARKQAERMGLVRKGDGMELDHIMPLSLGGANDQTNWQVMSRTDNRRKGSKWDGKSGSRLKEARSKRKGRNGFKIKDAMGTELPCKHDVSTMPPQFEHPQGLSGVIKRKEIKRGKGIMYYKLRIGKKTYEGEISGYGYASRGVDDFGPFSMRLREEHPDIPMPMHEPQIVFGWATGDLRIFDV